MRLAVITGADSAYFELMQKLLTTLSSAKTGLTYDLCVLDFGLSIDQIAFATHYSASVIRPDWAFEAPEGLKSESNLGYATRPILPRYFPNYDMYLWLDADISVQDGRFMSSFTAAAEDGSLAIAEEVDRSYRILPHALKWQIGNAFRCFGFRDGLSLCRGRPINSGVFALRGDAPHWARWQKRYQQAIDRAGRVNLDQHALMAALYLDGMPCRYLDSTHNWICTRSQPLWDETEQVFRRPRAPYEKINVLHLAGRDKDKLRNVKTLRGATRMMHLSYSGHQEALLNGEGKAALA